MAGRIAELVRRHQPGPEAAGTLEILAQTELAVVALVLAHRAFVVAGVAGDMRERLVTLDEAAGLADDDREFALVVVGFGDLLVRRPQRLSVPDLTDRHAQENLRISR